MHIRKQLVAAALAMGLWGCGDATLKLAGEVCVASSECAAGLVCDLVADPHVCSTMQTPVPDAGVDPIDAAVPVIDAAVPDAALIDADPPDADPPDADPPDADTT